MNAKRLRKSMEEARGYSLEKLSNEIEWWTSSLKRWIKLYSFYQQYNLSPSFFDECKSHMIDSHTIKQALCYEYLKRFNDDIHMTPAQIQQMSKKFIDRLIDTCLHGGGEVSIERLEDRMTLVFKLADNCIYRSNSPHLKCAVNPKGDCQTCPYKEVK